MFWFRLSSLEGFLQGSVGRASLFPLRQHLKCSHKQWINNVKKFDKKFQAYSGTLRVPASSAAAAITPGPAVCSPGLPLCERPAEYKTDVEKLLYWRQNALYKIASVGNAWAVQDNGPSQADLETELSWLLDDAVAGVVQQGGGRMRKSWRSVERLLEQNEEIAPAYVELRTSLETLNALWDQRIQERAPLQYVTCSAYWRDMVLSVGPGILIPRPETEQMIDYVAEAASANPMLSHGVWADLGTGSGALAIGVARQLLDVSKVYAVDLNPLALSYAAFNAERMDVAQRVQPLEGSWFEPLHQAGVGMLAGVVSNPPYITSQQMPSLQAEVGRHEPHLALDGGDGLGIDCLVPICTGAVEMLQPGGFLALETGGGQQAHYIADVLRRLRDVQRQHQDEWVPDSRGCLAFSNVAVRQDYFGVERFVTAVRSGLQV